MNLTRSGRAAAVVILLAAVGVAAYWPVWHHGVFVLDDFDYVANNPGVKGLSSFLGDLHELRYVGYLSFAIDHAVAGTEPAWYHKTNIVLHILNAALVFLLVGGLLKAWSAQEGADQPPAGATGAALACALLFLVHPLQTQAASYVSQRFTVLATSFYLATVLQYLYLRRVSEQGLSGTVHVWLPFAGSVATALLGVKTKEVTFTLPLALLLVECLVFEASRYGFRRFVFLVPYACASLVIPLSLFAVELGLVHPESQIYENMRVAKQADLLALSPYIYLITQFRVLVRYLGLFVLPLGMRAEYDFAASRSVAETAVLGSLVLLLVIAFLGGWAWQRSRNLPGEPRRWARLGAFGIGWFFVTASVESSVIPIKHLIFEHRVYLPSVGLILGAGGFLALMWSRLRSRLPPSKAFFRVGIALCIPLAAGTYVRNRVWTDPILFWSDVIEKSPGLLAGWHNRAVEHRNAGHIELALADLDRGVSHVGASFRTESSWPDPDLNPENVAKVYGVRAKILAQQGQFDRAEKDFLQVLPMARIAQDRSLVLSVLVDIADSIRDNGSCEAALPLYSRILSAMPGSLDAGYHRGWCLASLGRLEEGLADLDLVLRTDPTAANVYYDRAAIQRELKNFREAQADLERACRLGFEPACVTLERPGHGGGAQGTEGLQIPEREAHGL